jgi:flagellar assembly protein FliH
MRSSSNARAEFAHVQSFDSWTPDIVVGRPLGKLSSAEVQAAIDDAVKAALEEAEVVFQDREAELLYDTSARIEAARKEGYQRGFNEGREAGEMGEAARLRNASAAAEEAVDELRAGEVRWTGTIEENICALATVIARQVLERELAMDIEPVAALVRSALSEFPIDQPIRIRINPSDLNALASVGAVESDPLRGIAQDREARWLPDSSIAPGGCVVEGRERIIDGRIDTALERVYRRLTYTNA